jgi:hypothetical protein
VQGRGTRTSPGGKGQQAWPTNRELSCATCYRSFRVASHGTTHGDTWVKSRAGRTYTTHQTEF